MSNVLRRGVAAHVRRRPAIVFSSGGAAASSNMCGRVANVTDSYCAGGSRYGYSTSSQSQNVREKGGRGIFNFLANTKFFRFNSKPLIIDGVEVSRAAMPGVGGANLTSLIVSTVVGAGIVAVVAMSYYPMNAPCEVDHETEMCNWSGTYHVVVNNTYKPQSKSELEG